jgi:hypothetical protein
MSTPQLGVPPAMKESDWRKMYYGFVDPRLAGGVAAGGAAAALGGQEYFADSINEMERKRLEDEARRRAMMEAQ